MLTVSQDYLNLFNAPARKVEFDVALIEQSNFNFPSDITITTTASGYKSLWTHHRYVADGQPLEPHKYWIAHAPGDNIPDSAKFKLTEGYLRRLWASDATQPYNHGWWSNTKSDSDGNFSTYPWIDVAYSPEVLANFIRVCTTQVFAGIKSFRLSVKYSGSQNYTVLGTYMIPSGQYQYTVSLGGVKSIVNIKVEVISTYWPTDYARITEIAPILEWSSSSTPVTDYTLDIRVEKSSGSSDPAKPHAPGVGANRLDITFSRNILDVVRPVENQQVVAYISFDGANDRLPLGQFIVLGEVEEEKSSFRCQAYSSLQLAKFRDVPDYIFVQETTKSIIRKVLEDLGYSADKITFSLASNPTWTLYALEGKEGDRVLSDLCDHFGVAIYQDENSKIIVRSNYGSPVATLTDNQITNLRVSRAAAINAVTVHYAILQVKAEDTVWENDELELPPQTTVNLIFPLSKRPAVRIQPLIGPEPPISGIYLNRWQSNGFYLNISISNLNSNTITIPQGAMRLVGCPISMSPERVVQAKNSDSIRRLGLREYSLNLYCGKDSEAQAVADRLLNYLSKADVYEVELAGRPAPHLQLRDVVTISSNHFNINRDMVITEIELDKNGTRLKLIPKEALV